MGHEEVAANLGEIPNKSIPSLLIGMAIKYGLPSVCCIWLFYVIWCKDQQIFSMAKDVTTALTQSTIAIAESNRYRSEDTQAKERLAAAVDKLASRTP